MKQPHGTTSVMISTTLLSCFFKFIAVLLLPRWCDATCFQCDRARRPTDRTRNIHLFLYFFPWQDVRSLRWSVDLKELCLFCCCHGDGVGGREKRRRRGGEGMKRKRPDGGDGATIAALRFLLIEIIVRQHVSDLPSCMFCIVESLSCAVWMY